MGNQHLKEHGFHIYSSLIAAFERKSRSDRLAKSRYFGILSDGSPGKHDKVEHENVQTRFVDKETGIPENVFAGINALEHQDHEGVIRAIEIELLKLGIVLDGDDLVYVTAKRLVFLCLDGASVNMGKYNSVKAVLQRRFPWLIVIHCINHNLELAVGDLRKHDKEYLNFDETLKDIYSMFHFSIKRPVK